MDPERLISDYLDDALTPEEIAALFDWIRSDPDNARQFASAAFLHRRLQHRLSAMRLLEENAGLANASLDDPSTCNAPHPAAASGQQTQNAPALPEPAPVAQPRAARSISNRWRISAIAAALLLIISVLTFIAWPRPSPARLLATENAAWASGIAPPKAGDRLANIPFVLSSGLVKLGFDNGNQVIIEGPARFTVADAQAMTLDQGALTAIITSAGRGFSVSTPAARVTDLGTEFGVRTSPAATRVIVFRGKVRVDAASAPPRELSAGSALDVAPAGITSAPFDPTPFTRTMAADLRPLDLVDLLAGGDGTGSASGIGIDAATGRANEIQAVTIRKGDRRYVRINDRPALDGCFIPGGKMPVDSAGHLFTFPATTLVSYGLVWAGPNIPWEGELQIATTLPDDAATPTPRVLVMHSNNGITLNLDAIRALHPRRTLTAFRARVGNSYRPATPDAGPAHPLASIHLVVDGIARFENRAFANTDLPFEAACTLSDNDHFLTLATTDGGDGNACDWVLWTHPEISVEPRGE